MLAYSLSRCCSGQELYNCSHTQLTPRQIYYYALKPIQLEQYMCDKCEHKVDALKGLSISKLPDVFVVHLKRFVFDYTSSERTKVDDILRFPRSMNFTECIGGISKTAPTSSARQDENSPSGNLGINAETEIPEGDDVSKNDETYELVACVMHSGTARFGHYISLRRQGDAWVECNDQHVRTLSPNEHVRYFGSGDGEPGILARGRAYMLFYERVGGLKEETRALKLPRALHTQIQQRNETWKSIAELDRISTQVRKIALSPADAIALGGEMNGVAKLDVYIHQSDSLEKVRSFCFLKYYTSVRLRWRIVFLLKIVTTHVFNIMCDILCSCIKKELKIKHNT
jgi:hypothetical protein